jgi:hypothetical protein
LSILSLLRHSVERIPEILSMFTRN